MHDCLFWIRFSETLGLGGFSPVVVLRKELMKITTQRTRREFLRLMNRNLEDP
ncbi:hypothetical protein F383_06457 [Gossypium arboreum]|uniref:Uncharacterized protein n=1 Tax=Gossypium arboreum TaxID=29729 RepID=A0A0B0NYU9_GOSAR|nr:hypothetical protein F383_06457 [Gossypium arboreum]